MKILHRLFLNATLAVFVLAGCETTHLPQSELESPKKSVDGSAVVYQLATPCVSLIFYAVPELEPGKYGKKFNQHNSGSGGWFAGKNINTKLRYWKLPPGRYAIDSVGCTIGNGTYSTPYGKAVMYGEFDVEPGKVTYIGKIYASVSNGYFDLEVVDKSQDAKRDFSEMSKPGELQVKLMEVPLGMASKDRLKVLKLLLEELQKARETKEQTPTES